MFEVPSTAEQDAFFGQLLAAAGQTLEEYRATRQPTLHDAYMHAAEVTHDEVSYQRQLRRNLRKLNRLTRPSTRIIRSPRQRSHGRRRRSVRRVRRTATSSDGASSSHLHSPGKLEPLRKALFFIARAVRIDALLEGLRARIEYHATIERNARRREARLAADTVPKRAEAEYRVARRAKNTPLLKLYWDAVTLAKGYAQDGERRQGIVRGQRKQRGKEYIVDVKDYDDDNDDDGGNEKWCNATDKIGTNHTTFADHIRDKGVRHSPVTDAILRAHTANPRRSHVDVAAEVGCSREHVTKLRNELEHTLSDRSLDVLSTIAAEMARGDAGTKLQIDTKGWDPQLAARCLDEKQGLREDVRWLAIERITRPGAKSWTMPSAIKQARIELDALTTPIVRRTPCKVCRAFFDSPAAAYVHAKAQHAEEVAAFRERLREDEESPTLLGMCVPAPKRAPVDIFRKLGADLSWQQLEDAIHSPALQKQVVRHVHRRLGLTLFASFQPNVNRVASPPM